MTSFTIPVDLFSWEESIDYLNRNPLECTHLVKNHRVYKLLELPDASLALLQLSQKGEQLVVETNKQVAVEMQQWLKAYVSNWFDLRRDLSTFYKQMEQDALLAPLCVRYEGLRIVQIPDLFEALCWAIIGQQINLTFAYKLRLRLVELYGESEEIEGQALYTFPNPVRIAGIQPEDLRPYQFSQRKAEYIIGIAQAIIEGRLDQQQLATQSFEEAHRNLVNLRGVGNWTANYVLMKTYGHCQAFPIEDVGLHNGIKLLWEHDRKPTLEELKVLAKSWEGWEAYATFYIWHHLMKWEREAKF